MAQDDEKRSVLRDGALGLQKQVALRPATKGYSTKGCSRRITAAAALPSSDQLNRGDGVALESAQLWRTAVDRPLINLDAYRERVRKKFGLPQHSSVQVSRLSRLEKSLSQANVGLRKQLAKMSAALDRSDAQCANEAANRLAIDEKFSRLMHTLPVGVVELDSAGIVRVTNPAADTILGRPVTGRTWFEVVQQTFSPQADDGYEISTHAGKRVSVQTQSLDDPAGQLILLTDQTDTRELQSRLAQNDRLAALGRTTATLAHQVRTPVCGALLYLSQVMRDKQLTLTSRDRLQKAVGRLEHLERQVKQILMLSKGQVPKSDRVALQQLVLATRAAIAPIQSQTDCVIDIQADVDPEASATLNQEALVGCCVNLVENAVLACEQGGNIQVKFSVETLNGNDALQIGVIDDGPGMDAAALASATKPFFTSRANGTGLGLSLVKMVVEAHGGAIALDSKTGCGTRATLTLPLNERSL